MVFDPNNVPTAPLDAGNSPAGKPVRPLPQPEWRPGISAAEWDDGKPRNASINFYLRQAVEAHRASGLPWRNDVATSPLDRDARVTSGYSLVRVHPVTGKVTGHPALDITAPGANAVAMLPGTVLYVGYFSEAAGESIMMLNDNGEIDFYAHMEPGSTMHIYPGQRVRHGQIIGVMGGTGVVTGPHMHTTRRKMGPEEELKSAQAQARSLPGYVAPVIINANTGLPMPPAPVTDPAFDWEQYKNIYPQVNGGQYAVEQTVPGPSRAILMAGNPLPRIEDFFPPEVVATVEPAAEPMPTAEVTEAPTQSNAPLVGGQIGTKGLPPKF